MGRRRYDVEPSAALWGKGEDPDTKLTECLGHLAGELISHTTLRFNARFC